MRIALALAIIAAGSPALALDDVPPGPDARVVRRGEEPPHVKAYREKMAAEADALRAQQKGRDLKAKKAMSGICQGC